MSDPLDAIELTCGGQTVGIVPRHGGGISHWRRRLRGTWHDLLRPATDAGLRLDGPLSLGCFPLVPYSNRIRDGRFRFEGEEIRLPLNFGDHPHSIHGQAWQAAWRVTAQEAARVELAYRHRADAWPFDYSTRQSVELTEQGFSLALSLTNLAGRPMPAGLGFHPYFSGAREARLTANVDAVWLTDAEVLPTELVALPPRWNLPDGVAVAGMDADNLFTGWRGEALIERRSPGLRLRLQADGPLRHLVIYAPPGADFFCVEPVSHITDAVNAAADRAETGLEVLAPGATLEAALRIAVEEV